MFETERQRDIYLLFYILHANLMSSFCSVPIVQNSLYLYWFQGTSIFAGQPTHTPLSGKSGQPTHTPLSGKAGQPTHTPLSGKAGQPTHTPLSGKSGQPTHTPLSGKSGRPTHTPLSGKSLTLSYS